MSTIISQSFVPSSKKIFHSFHLGSIFNNCPKLGWFWFFQKYKSYLWNSLWNRVLSLSWAVWPLDGATGELRTTADVGWGTTIGLLRAEVGFWFWSWIVGVRFRFTEAIEAEVDKIEAVCVALVDLDTTFSFLPRALINWDARTEVLPPSEQ